MNFRRFILASAAAAFLSFPVVAKPSGWFVGLAGGYNVVEDTQFMDGPVGGPFATAGSILEMDGGWAALGTVGYRWPTNWRLEAEVGYRSNDGVGTTPLGVVIPGSAPEIEEWSFMGNAFFDFPITQKLTFSAGAGLGADMITVTDGASEIDDTVLAGQLIAQIGYMVTNRIELYADYHYLVLDNPEFDLTRAGTSLEVDKHTALIGLRYDLHADETPVVYVPPPPLPPAPPPAMKQYVVFFEFNKYNLTAAAQTVVAEAAAQAKSGGAVSLMVVGHTDTSGGVRYNQMLSEKRANAVANALVRQGIAQDSISASGRGETELVVDTGDGVKEPQNRRATIDLQ